MGGAGGNYAWDSRDIKHARGVSTAYVIRERGGRGGQQPIGGLSEQRGGMCLHVACM